MTLYGCFSTILFYSWFKFFSNHAVKIFLTWFEHFVSNGVISKGSFFGWCLVGKLDFNLVKYSKKLQPILRKVCWQTLIVSLLNFFFLFFFGGWGLFYFIFFSRKNTFIKIYLYNFYCTQEMTEITVHHR